MFQQPPVMPYLSLAAVERILLTCKYELETKEVLTYNIASLSNYILFFLSYNKKSKLGAERLLLVNFFINLQQQLTK
jgi:hypothetical protein